MTDTDSAIVHHLDPATLMAFAAGTLAPAVAAVAAQHIAMCRHCRKDQTIAERLGRGLIDELAGAAGGLGAGAILAKPNAARKAEIDLFCSRLSDLDSVPWRWIGPGLWHHKLAAGGAGSLHLLKAAPGARVPAHDHAGDELTLVLRGALVEGHERYGVGDVADHDETEENHQPAADAVQGCICIIGAEGKVRFRSLLARFVQPYHGL